jgi:prephenate dehydrogenase
MGAWFATFLKENGYRVMISDRNKQAARGIARKRGFRLAPDQETAITSSQLVVLATPTLTTKRILEQILHVLSPGVLLIEISSAKEPLRRILQKHRKRGVSILSIHPMFGPGAKTLRGRTVLVTAIPRRNIHASRIMLLFRKRGAKVIQCSISEHDRLISVLLTLPHFVNMAMVNTLMNMGFDPDRLRRFSGTTFSLQLLIAEAIYQESPENETSILMDGGQSVKTLQEYVRHCNAALSTLRKGKRMRIIGDLHSGRSFLQRDRKFAAAYSDFNAAVNAAVH